MPVYESKGTLTGTIEPKNVAAAQKYLTEDRMAQYLDPPLSGVVEMLEWQLDGNGHDYKVRAFCTRELTPEELTKLASEVSGQNSDGLGEGFEQQDFAECDDDDEESEEDCTACDGSGYLGDSDDECGDCDGNGFIEVYREGCTTISFDWQTNDSVFTRIV